ERREKKGNNKKKKSRRDFNRFPSAEKADQLSFFLSLMEKGRDLLSPLFGLRVFCVSTQLLQQQQ
ncbi:MAG: hypothetical protein MJ082_03430, partial [Clostridia bacterium]|nr:hypothetical protein [Clostridia bacterium]